MTVTIGRRELLVVLGGAAAWPLAARAQQREKMRRIGVLMNLSPDDAEGQAPSRGVPAGVAGSGLGCRPQCPDRAPLGRGRHRALSQPCRGIGASRTGVILAAGGIAAQALQRVSRTIPIVFANAADPVGAGLVASLARPGGNATGFTTFEFSMGGKWLELLKQIAPGITRAEVLRDSSNLSGIGEFGAIQAVAPSFGVELLPVDVSNADEIERAIAAFAGASNGGLIVTQNAGALLHRKLIIALAARHRLPAVYAYSSFVVDGGLISYGPDSMDGYRRAASYVDRILNGAKPADLPVQAPVKYETVINLKTARALGLDVPPTVLARADEVIE